MSIIICRNCGREQALPAGLDIAPCVACGTMNSKPRADADSCEMLARATKQRLRCDFVHAENSYQYVLRASPEAHEALWGLALCRYGVEYVEDPRTGKRLPTVHSVRRKPIQLDPDYLGAIDCAPEDVRVQYEKEAAYIDNAMARIIELSQRCLPFEVFLCHKTTQSDTGEKTEDYDRAFKLYHELDKLGYKVFFAPMEMEGVAAGSDYEAAIYHALDTAKVMLLICSDTDALNSAWVRSEWTRFLEFADEKAEKCLVPLLYGKYEAKKLPTEIKARKLQGLVMEDLNAKSVILNLLEKMCPKNQKRAAPNKEGESLSKTKNGEEMQKTSSKARVSTSKKSQDKPEQKAVPKEGEKSQTITYTPEKYFEVMGWGMDTCEITGYTGPDTDILIPPTIGGKKVEKISRHVCYPYGESGKWNSPQWSLGIVYIPETVKYLSNFAFDGVSVREFRVSEINPDYDAKDGVLFRKSKATGRKLIAYPQGRKEQSYSVPSGTDEISCLAFSHAENLKEVSIPEGLTSIDENAFVRCKNLRKVHLPDSLWNIGFQAFGDCKALESLTLPKSELLKMDEKAFVGCSALMLRVCMGSRAHALLKNSERIHRYELLSPGGQTLEKATIIYTRKKKMLDSLLCHAIRVDGNETQIVTNGGRVCFKVAPGKHCVELYGLFGVLGNAIETPDWAKADSTYTRELLPGEVIEIVIPT